MKAMSRMVALPQFLLNNQNQFHSLEPFLPKKFLNLITDQTNIYGKGKKQSSNQRKTSQWKDVSKKEIESFLRLVILMGINHLTNRKLYWSKDMVFHNTFISSIMSRDRFLEIFYHLHLANQSLKPKREFKDYSQIYKVKNFTEIFKKMITLVTVVQSTKVC